MPRAGLIRENRLSEARSVCIIDENCPLAADRRVWQEALALRDAGYRVSVICPKGPGFERAKVTEEGIEVFPHGRWEGSSLTGYFLEYFAAFLTEFWLALRIYRRNRFQILQACNPPDNIFLIALFFKILFGVKFIYDHHDPCPELYEARAQKRGVLYWALLFLERLTFRTADVTIATNETIQDIARTRGKVNPERTFVVRTCPDLERLRVPEPNPKLRAGRQYLVVYVGHIGPQDGLDLLLDSIYHLVYTQGRRDTLFAIIGSGSELPRLIRRASALNLSAHVRFTGQLYGESLFAYLATADVGVSPDPYNAFNDKLTMIKIMEYMAFGIPVVLYDLTEGRRSAGAAALYAAPNDPIEFAARIADLVDSEGLRFQLSKIGRRRIREQLNWSTEKLKLLKAYGTALGTTEQVASAVAVGVASAEKLGL